MFDKIFENYNFLQPTPVDSSELIYFTNTRYRYIEEYAEIGSNFNNYVHTCENRIQLHPYYIDSNYIEHDLNKIILHEFYQTVYKNSTQFPLEKLCLSSFNESNNAKKITDAIYDGVHSIQKNTNDTSNVVILSYTLFHYLAQSNVFSYDDIDTNSSMSLVGSLLNFVDVYVDYTTTEDFLIIGSFKQDGIKLFYNSHNINMSYNHTGINIELIVAAIGQDVKGKCIFYNTNIKIDPMLKIIKETDEFFY